MSPNVYQQGASFGAPVYHAYPFALQQPQFDSYTMVSMLAASQAETRHMQQQQYVQQQQQYVQQQQLEHMQAALQQLTLPAAESSSVASDDERQKLQDEITRLTGASLQQETEQEALEKQLEALRYSADAEASSLKAVIESMSQCHNYDLEGLRKQMQDAADQHAKELQESIELTDIANKKILEDARHAYDEIEALMEDRNRLDRQCADLHELVQKESSISRALASRQAAAETERLDALAQSQVFIKDNQALREQVRELNAQVLSLEEQTGVLKDTISEKELLHGQAAAILQGNLHKAQVDLRRAQKRQTTLQDDKNSLVEACGQKDKCLREQVEGTAQIALDLIKMQKTMDDQQKAYRTNDELLNQIAFSLARCRSDQSTAGDNEHILSATFLDLARHYHAERELVLRGRREQRHLFVSVDYHAACVGAVPDHPFEGCESSDPPRTGYHQVPVSESWPDVCESGQAHACKTVRRCRTGNQRRQREFHDRRDQVQSFFVDSSNH